MDGATGEVPMRGARVSPMPTRRHLLLCAVLGVNLLACIAPHPPSPDAGDGDPDAGQPTDAGEVPVADGWSWLAVEGSRCAQGATAGIGIRRGTDPEDLLIYLQGGGACWNRGTCAPSHAQFGPVCYYGENLCLFEGEGGAKPLSVHVATRDPFPANGQGAFVNDLAVLDRTELLRATLPGNPFRGATAIYVPYCTGDLHVGDASVEFDVRAGIGAPITKRPFHFAGAANMALYLEELKARFPQTKRIWLTGASAGGYGATFHFERVRAAFPDAEVHLLADSAPLIQPHWWAEAKALWQPAFPEACDDCDDGLPQWMEHVLDGSGPRHRVALLAYANDATLAYYFFGGVGPEAVLNPPTGAYRSALDALLTRYQGRTSAGAFILPGTQHVMLGGYGMINADGSVSAPYPSADGSTNLRRWIDGWATGN